MSKGRTRRTRRTRNKSRLQRSLSTLGPKAMNKLASRKTKEKSGEGK
jgi:hypothetical protein